MTRFADPHRCPGCGGRLVPQHLVCPSCGLDLSGPLGHELFVTLSRADQLVDALRERSYPQPPSPDMSAGMPAAPAQPTSAQPTSAQPTSAQPVATGVRASSVPKILLSLGAVCVLVAALVFLAVTWSILGVGGRTVTLLVLTAGAALLTRWVAGRALRGATEAIGLVTAGLATLDVLGARRAGWLGDPGGASFAVGLGALLVVGGLLAARALRGTPVGRFTGGELTATAGALTAASGIAVQSWGSTSQRLVVAVVVLAALAAGCWTGSAGRWRFPVAATGVTVAAWLFWVGLVGSGIDDVRLPTTYAEAWGRLRIWGMLAAAALAVGVALVRPVLRPLRVASAAAGVLVLGLAAVLPALDGSATEATAAVLLALVVLSAALALPPRPWGAAAAPAAAVAAVFVGGQALVLTALASGRYADAAGERWNGTLDGRLPAADPGGPAPWLLPLCLVGLAAAGWAAARLVDRGSEVSFRRAVSSLGWLVAAALGIGLFGLLLLSPVPVWAVVVPLLLVGSVAAGHGIATQWWPSLSVAGFALVAALGLGLYEEWLTLAAVGVCLLAAVALHLHTRRIALATAAGAVVPALAAALVWTVGALGSGPAWTGPARTWTGFAGVVALALLVLVRPALRVGIRREPVLAGWEVGAAIAALVLLPAGVEAAGRDRPLWAAAYLSVAGAAATAMALLRAERREVAWIGGALLALASWVRLADLGVGQPEPYVLPSAAALLAVGLWKLRRDPATPTHRALGPAITVGLLPSWLWALADPFSLRALLVGLGCAALVAAGVAARWSAPLVYGALFGLVLVVWEAAPYVDAAVPRWALIGVAGAALIVAGATWEQRLQEARAVTGYVRRLR